MMPNATSDPYESDLLDTVYSDREDDPGEVFEKAQKTFTKLNKRFKKRLQRVDEAKQMGEEVTAEQSAALEKAHRAADEAHKVLDRAQATLRAAGADNGAHEEVAKSSGFEDQTQSKADAEQKLQAAQQLFDEMNRIFTECLQKEEVAKQLDVTLPKEDREALEVAHLKVSDAQQALDAARLALQTAEDVEEENTILSREDSEIRVQQARDNFARVNQIFEEKMRSMNEAKANGEEVTADERNAVAQADKDAKRAHMKLDKAVAALSIAEKAEKEGTTVIKVTGQDAAEASEGVGEALSVADAEQKLHAAQEHFAEVDHLFQEKLQKGDKVTMMGGELTVEAKEALEAAHQDAFNAQKAVDQAAEMLNDAREKQPEQSVLSLDEAEQRVQEAKDLFASVNQDFEQKRASVNEAKASGDVVTPEELNALAEANERATRAHMMLDKAAAALRVAETAEKTSVVHAASSEVPVSPEDAVERVQQAQDYFTEVNKDFQDKERVVEEAKARGEEVSDEESEALTEAHRRAVDAANALDKASHALDAVSAGGDQKQEVLSREEAEQKVQQARDHFAEVNQDFEEKMHRVADIRALGEEVTHTESEELAQANKDATFAHKQLDQAVAALGAVEMAERDGSEVSKHMMGSATEEELDDDLDESVFEDAVHEAKLLVREATRAQEAQLAKVNRGKKAGKSTEMSAKQTAKLEIDVSVAQQILHQLVQARSSHASSAVKKAAKRWTIAKKKSRKMDKLALRAKKVLDKDTLNQ